MKILVAQMTRMGDMLQTSPLVRALKQRHPDAHITAMVRRMGVPIAERHPDIDDILVYDEDEMFIHLRSQDSDRLLRAYAWAESLAGTIRERRFDVVYNCTQSIPSAMLFTLSGSPNVIGAHLSDDWQFVLRGRWTNYFFTSIFQRQYSNINLCDVFRNLMTDAPPCEELVFQLTDEDRRGASAILDECGIGEDERLVCFQMGASDEKKRWPVRCFAELGRRVAHELGYRIALVGVKDEAPLGEAFEKEAPGIAVHLFGKTNIPQVAAVLERSAALVSNDTGTMHIAAAVRCPILLVSVGYVHFRETGPYGTGHYAVEQRHEDPAAMIRGAEDGAALDAIRPGQVLALLTTLLHREGGAPADADLEGLDAYRSESAPDGFLEWYPLIRRDMTETDYLRTAYRAMWLEHLSGRSNPELERRALERLLSCYASSNAAALDAWRRAREAEFAHLADAAGNGAAWTEQLVALLEQGGSMREAKEKVDRLMGLDEEIRLFGELHERCRPLIVIGRFERDNLEGADPLVLARATLQIYKDLQVRARLMCVKLETVSAVWHETHGPNDPGD